MPQLPHRFLKSSLSGALAHLILFVAGCTSYRAKPLDLKSVNSALEPPSLAATRVKVSQISHPLLQPWVIDGRDGFTPDEIGIMAVVTSPQLRALRAQRGVAQAQLLQAGILPNPQLGYTLDRLHGDNGPGLVDARSLGLSWEITALLSHHALVSQAKATAEALDLDIAWQEWEGYEDARTHAFRLLSLQEQLPLAREAEAGLAGAVAATQQALAHSYETASNLAVAMDAWTQAQAARFTLQQQINAETSALKLALTWPADQPLKLKAAPAFPAFSNSVESTARDLLVDLEKHRLDLVALTLGYQSQEAALRAAVRSQFPKIGLTLDRANDTSNVKTHGIGVTIDIPLFDRNQGAIAIAKATRQQLFEEYIARVAEARSQVYQILSDLTLIREQLQTASTAQTELENFQAALEKASISGNTDAVTYRTAQAAALKGRMEEAALRQQLVELYLGLEIATGRPLLNRSSAL